MAQGVNVDTLGFKKVPHPMNFGSQLFGVINIAKFGVEALQQTLDDWFLAASRKLELPMKSTYVQDFVNWKGPALSVLLQLQRDGSAKGGKTVADAFAAVQAAERCAPATCVNTQTGTWCVV